MAALLRSALRRAAAPAFRFSGHPAATGAAMRRAMHTGGGWHRFYETGSPVFFGGGQWQRIDNYFAAFAAVMMLAYRHYATEQADERWSRERRRQEQQERMWGRFQTTGVPIPNSGEGPRVDIEANSCKL